MSTRERRLDRGRRLSRRTLLAIGEELREARIQAGLTQRELGAPVGISASEISRIEHGQSPHVAYETLAALGAALGLDIPLRAYPNGDAVRDAAQLALLARFRALLPAGLRHRTEVPLGILGDRRAWDEVLDGPGWSLPVEAEIAPARRSGAPPQARPEVSRCRRRPHTAARRRHPAQPPRPAPGRSRVRGRIPGRRTRSLEIPQAGTLPTGSAVILV